MNIDENEKTELFDEFYEWLKKDGLKPKTSERLHRKKILASLLANKKMTIDNFVDFIEDCKIQNIKNLRGKTLDYNNESYIINEVIINMKEEKFILNCKSIGLDINMSCKFSQLNDIKALIVLDKF